MNEKCRQRGEQGIQSKPGHNSFKTRSQFIQFNQNPITIHSKPGHNSFNSITTQSKMIQFDHNPFIYSFIQNPITTHPSTHPFTHSLTDISLYTGLSAVSSVQCRFCRMAVRMSPLSHSITCPFPSIDKIGTSDPSWITADPSSNPIPSYASPSLPSLHLARLLRALHRPHAAARVVQRQLAATSQFVHIPTGTSRCARSAETRPRSPTR